MSEIDQATQLLCATKTIHKERMVEHVTQLVVHAMTLLTENLKVAAVGEEIVKIRLDGFQNEWDVLYIEFCNIMRQKLGSDLVIDWCGGRVLQKEYVIIALNISPFRS